MYPVEEPTPEVRSPLLADKVALLRIAAERNARMGIVYNPEGTAASYRAAIERGGVWPEENLVSRAIIEARHGVE